MDKYLYIKSANKKLMANNYLRNGAGLSIVVPHQKGILMARYGLPTWLDGIRPTEAKQIPDKFVQWLHHDHKQTAVVHTAGEESLSVAANGTYHTGWDSEYHRICFDSSDMFTGSMLTNHIADEGLVALPVISMNNLNEFLEWYAQGQPENVNPVNVNDVITKYNAVLVNDKGLYVWSNEEDAAVCLSLFFNFGMKMKIMQNRSNHWINAWMNVNE